MKPAAQPPFEANSPRLMASWHTLHNDSAEQVPGSVGRTGDMQGAAPDNDLGATLPEPGSPVGPVVRFVLILSAIVVGACSSAGSGPAATASRVSEPPASASTPEDHDPLALPLRDGPRRQTTGSVPHIQLDANAVPAVDAELRRRVFQLPGVEDRPSDRSLPGARGLAFTDDLELARRDVIAGSREFAHIHPDGSLHVWLAVDSAMEIEEKRWGEFHPWVERDGFWDGVVMVFTPETLEELEVTIEIVVDAYNFVVGANLRPADIT